MSRDHAAHNNTYQNGLQVNKVSPWAPIHDPAKAELWDEFPNGRYGDSRSPGNTEETLYF